MKVSSVIFLALKKYLFHYANHIKITSIKNCNAYCFMLLFMFMFNVMLIFIVSKCLTMCAKENMVTINSDFRFLKINIFMMFPHNQKSYLSKLF